MKFLETDKALTCMPRMPNMVGGINYNDDRVESEGADREPCQSLSLDFSHIFLLNHCAVYLKLMQ